MKMACGMLAVMSFLVVLGVAGSVEHGAHIARLLFAIPALAGVAIFANGYHKFS